jgi:hypothetical protein
MNGFQYFMAEMETDFLRYIFSQMQAVGEEYGLDCVEIAIGENSDIAISLECQGSRVGMLCYLQHQWGYSFDRDEMFPTPTPERAAHCLMLEYTENGGIIGDIAA